MAPIRRSVRGNGSHLSEITWFNSSVTTYRPSQTPSVNPSNYWWCNEVWLILKHHWIFEAMLAWGFWMVSSLWANGFQNLVSWCLFLSQEWVTPEHLGLLESFGKSLRHLWFKDAPWMIPCGMVPPRDIDSLYLVVTPRWMEEIWLLLASGW